VSLTKTDTLAEGNERTAVSSCTCVACDNRWWVRWSQDSEFRPSYCPYCGVKFTYYHDGHDNAYGTDGRKLP